jgi:hypothetical protein
MNAKSENNQNRGKLQRNRRLSVVVLAIGSVLMARQMYFDDEPGAIPLLLVLIGLTWYLVTRSRIRAHQKSA